MKGLIRGVACIAVALGVTACEDDPSLDFGGKPTQVQLSPEVFFVTSGIPKNVRVRLVNDRNQSVPTSWTVSNVGAGLEVILDSLFRPVQETSGDTLRPQAVQIQHQYIVTPDIPTGAQRQFTLTSGAFSGTVTANIEPLVTGPLSLTAPGFTEPVTINAPATQSFTPTGTDSTRVFSVVGADTVRAFNTVLTNSSVTFVPAPGMSGTVFITGVTLNFAPTLVPRRLPAPNTISVARIPAVVGVSGAMQPQTVTAPGFKFLPNFNMSFGGVGAVTTSVAPDSNSAQVVFAAGFGPEAPRLSNISFATFLSGIITRSISANDLTTPTTPWNGSAPDGNARVITALDPLGTAVVTYDTWINTGGNFTPVGGAIVPGNTKFYRLVIPSAGVRIVTLNWTATAAGVFGNYDLMVCNDTFTACPIIRATTARPEVSTAATSNFAAGNYWIAVRNVSNGPEGLLTITVQ